MEKAAIISRTYGIAYLVLNQLRLDCCSRAIQETLFNYIEEAERLQTLQYLYSSYIAKFLDYRFGSPVKNHTNR